MAVNEKSLEELVRKLPPPRQAEVKDFVEFLLAREEASAASTAAEAEMSPLRSFEQCFGLWDSGDENSGDNERIDADLANEYEATHEARR